MHTRARRKAAHRTRPRPRLGRTRPRRLRLRPRMAAGRAQRPFRDRGLVRAGASAASTVGGGPRPRFGAASRMMARIDTSAAPGPGPSVPPQRQPSHRGEKPVLEISGGAGRITRDALAELWMFRGVLWAFTVREVKVRYKQAAIGVGWAILQPVVAAAIFALFLGRYAGISSEGVPYLLFALAGMVPWTYFSERGAERLASAGRQRVDAPQALLPARGAAVLLRSGIARRPAARHRGPRRRRRPLRRLAGADLARDPGAGRPSLVFAAAISVALSAHQRLLPRRQVRAALHDPDRPVPEPGRLPVHARSRSSGATSTRSSTRSPPRSTTCA